MSSTEYAQLLLYSSGTGILLVILVILFGGCMYLIHKLCCSNIIKTNKSGEIGTIILSETIKPSCFEKFGTQLQSLNKYKTITIVIQCYGGSAPDADRICLDILHHKKTYKCKFIAKIKKFALSAGSQIALCCDEIIADKTSYMSPCDTQMWSTYLQRSIPAADIKSVIEMRGSKVHSEFIILNNEHKRNTDTEKEIFDNMIDKSVVTTENKDVVYREFYSGKNSHHKTFSMDDIKKMGIWVTIQNSIEIEEKNPSLSLTPVTPIMDEIKVKT